MRRFEIRCLSLFGSLCLLWLALGCHRHEPSLAMAQAYTRSSTLAASSAEVAAAPITPPPFFTKLRDRARREARTAARSISRKPPPYVRELDYDAYRRIRFRPERSLWRSEPGRFEVQFFHQGFYFGDPVTVHVIGPEGAVRPFPFSPDLFVYEGTRPPTRGEHVDFSGLRIHAPINTESYRDEVIALQGASYFRAVGRDQAYGLSARGLAIDTGEPGGEEFPRFSELYLVRPGEHDEFVWVLALLEGPSVTGAYAMRVTPAESTQVDVHAEIFLRKEVDVVGIAPLTSMFWFGEADERRFGDFRPEVHDSDGVLMWTQSGEVLYRPLRNPERTTVCTFALDSPRGFGLVQRDRAFASYQDLEARYQDRPSAWVEPVRGFGPGSLRLLEIASDKETNDNVAVLWIPKDVPKEGLDLDYRLFFGKEPLPLPVHRAMRAVGTRVARTEKSRVRFVVDFAGAPSSPAAGIEGSVTVTGGRLVESHTEPNPFAEGTRLSFEFMPDAPDVELRAFLHRGERALSETWSYLWQSPSHSH